MRIQKKALLFLLLFWTVAQTFGQITTVRRYNPEATKPQQYSTPAATSTSKGSAAPAYESAEDQASRRAAALSRVQGAAAKSAPSTTTAKGLRPAEYSTDGTAPATYSTVPPPSTTMTVNGLEVQRNVRKGVGQVGSDLFTPVAELHFVQFAVYCKDTPVDKAPSIDGLMLLWHSGSKCPGGQPGASYIVKGYNTPEEAKNAVLQFKANRIDCWYNPSLTGAEVEVIGVR